MFSGWFSKKSRTQVSSALRAALSHYPAYCPPHAGDPGKLSAEQANDNLEDLLANGQTRVTALRAFFAEHAGIELPELSREMHYADAVEAIYRWAYAEWPLLTGGTRTSVRDWLASGKHGPNTVYAMIADLGFYFNETIRLKNTDFCWAIDQSVEAEPMPSFRRPVLMIAPTDKQPAPILVDMELAVFSLYATPNSISKSVVNDWLTAMDNAISGQLQAHWGV